MKYIGIFASLFIAFLILEPAYPAETNDLKEGFVGIGYVKNDAAKVRSGDNVNFETLCTLEKSYPVNIIGKRYSWYKISLPKQARVYINKDYVDPLYDQKNIGIVNASNVNLRAGPGTNYSIIGQVSDFEKLSVVSEENGWYEIEPPEGLIGWIHDSQVRLNTDSNTAPQENKKIESGLTTTLHLDQKPPEPRGNLIIRR
ncbi:MAG: SH3 domain-containing protein [Candidatus Omnitrophota bacterium]